MREKYQRLLEAYSEKNLTDITSKLIQLYKNKNVIALQRITQIVSDFTLVKDGNINSLFSQLMMLYHPDKSKNILEKINILLDHEKDSGLKTYLHILELNNLDELLSQISKEDDIEFEEEVQWEEDDGYNYFDEDDASYDNFDDDEEPGFDFDEPDNHDFYNAVKKKIYGNKNINFPPHYMEEYEEIEMSKSGIEDLSGVEYCKFIKKLHLNDNEITDISNLENLENLEELYVANNKIGFIDALENLENLKVIDLSFNQIDDLSPLFDLENLEYINILGNNIPKKQIEELKEREILIIL